MKNVLMAFALVLFTACSSDDSPIDYTAQNEEEILAYINTNNLNAQKSNSGLYYVIDEAGTGIQPTINDRVKIIDKGYFTNGEVFDETDENGLSFSDLLNVIPGWAEGLTYFKEGGKGKLILPARLAYNSGNNTIPAGSVLVFDIELVYINYKTENKLEIETYLTDNNLTAQETDSGLYYIIDDAGTGAQPTETDNVTITYSGYFTDDEIFDESSNNISFDLQNVIAGFKEGLTYFKEGGNGTLLLPAHLGYGNYSTSGIPGGSVLIFDVNLVSVN